ncbi:hypothetical protein MUN89_05530 [Halobacillus salinarum]|uniref:Uncharacterized protein n=1 Tax=Halobacillus salinarum TaxID=2932257 RepID=A0ABY4EP69_9BACI|nr:hypothetical protein [Halobacillus salinarum]UOQ45407.1 hypothetical protein MUN89_05530 [Halobacillus salinarum]
MYRLLYTQVEDDGERIMHIKSFREGRILLFYTSEIFHIRDSVLKAYLIPLLNKINNGSFDQPLNGNDRVQHIFNKI